MCGEQQGASIPCSIPATSRGMCRHQLYSHHLHFYTTREILKWVLGILISAPSRPASQPASTPCMSMRLRWNVVGSLQLLAGPGGHTSHRHANPDQIFRIVFHSLKTWVMKSVDCGWRVWSSSILTTTVPTSSLESQCFCFHFRVKYSSITTTTTFSLSKVYLMDNWFISA